MSLLRDSISHLLLSAIAEGIRKLKTSIRTTPQSSSAVPTTIDTLPDDVLIQIFDFCRAGRNPLGSPFHPVLEWHRLIHVCQRWRRIIFLSPRRLDLYILCTNGRPVRRNLGLWPAFPIIIDYVNYPNFSTSDSEIISPDDEDNVIAGLEHPNRVRCLKLPVTSLLLGKVATVAQQPFQMLTQLLLLSNKDENVSVLPSTFLAGSAPLLQEIYLEGIPFPTLPTLLSSATDLVILHLHRIPQTGYFSPEAMVARLGTLTRLEVLYVAFQSHSSRPNQSGNGERVAPVMQAVLPALTSFEFRGASEYLEDLVAQFDAPRLITFSIWFFNQLIFQVPQLFRFASRAQILEQAHQEARRMDAEIFFNENLVYINLYHGPVESGQILLDLQISCQGLDWQVSHLAVVLSQCSVILSNVGHLSIDAYDQQQSLRNDMDHIEWLELFRHFTTVETLEVSARLASHVADALKFVTVEMVPELVPTLQLLCLEDVLVGRVEEFIAMRQVSGRPVTIANSLYDFLVQRESRLWR